MICKFEPDPRLGVFICSYCGNQSKEQVKKICKVQTKARAAEAAKMIRERKPCNCGKKKKKQP